MRLKSKDNWFHFSPCIFKSVEMSTGGNLLENPARKKIPQQVTLELHYFLGAVGEGRAEDSVFTSIELQSCDS